MVPRYFDIDTIWPSSNQGVSVLLMLLALWCKNGPALVSGADDSTLDLLVLGDFGGLPYFPYRTYIEAAVAKQMGKFAAANQVDNVLTLGDNFYYDGVKNVNDPRFQVWQHP